MTDKQLLERITCDPKVMAGGPVVKGTRLTVDYVLNLLAHGSTVDELLEEYDGLQRDDVQACLLFASKSLADTVFPPLAMEDEFDRSIVQSSDQLARLADKALAEHRASLTRELDPDQL